MATETRSVPHGDRRVLLVALAILGGTTGAVFGRVFLGTHPAMRLAAAGVLAVIVAILMSRRSLWLSLVASAAGLLVALGWLVFPGSTWWGIPGPRTVEAIAASLDVVTQRAAAEIAPSPPLAPLMTAALMAVWSAATAAHALAIRSESSVLPLLPGAALLAFSGVVTEDPPRPGYVLLFLAAAFAVLFGQAMQRASSWGPGLTRTKTIFSGRWARVVGVVAALSAVLLPWVLPGFARPALVELDKPDTRIGVSPIVDLRPSLLQNPVADLFWVEADRPAYWRMVVLDRFDGRLWTASETAEAGKVAIGAGYRRFRELNAPRQRSLQHTVEIAELATPWLPAAADPFSIALEDDVGAIHDLRTGVLQVEAETSEGMRYEIGSEQPWPSSRQLDEIMPNNPLGDPRYTALPAGLPPRIEEIAFEITRSANTPVEQILAIQTHLRSFTYDDRAPAGHGVDDMLHFLEDSRRGYCEQFAGAMAVLVRALGHPARVAIGFLPGERQEDGRFRVTTGQVHAWPEVHFGAFGWLPFEPTPGRTNPSAQYLLPPAQRGTGLAGSTGGPIDEPGAASAVEQRESFQPLTGALDPVGDRRRAGRREETSKWWPTALSALGILLLALLLVPPAKAIARRLALSRARGGRSRVLAAYDWLLSGAADLGAGRRRSETPSEYRERLRAAAGLPQDALQRISSLADRALYASEGPDGRQAEEAVQAAREILRGMRRAAGPLRTLIAAVRPAASPG
jgi:transglutaminase-like putative cysteine protease